MLPKILTSSLLLFGAPSMLLPATDIKGPMPAEEGETCVVCYGSCTREDVAYLVDGQRFAVMKPLEKDFLADPDQYIRAYKPNTMQFSGDGPQGMSDGYLLFGLATLVGLIVTGFLAHQLILKRSDPSLVTAGLSKIPATKPPVPCAACGADNHPSAQNCSLCGADMKGGRS